MSSEFRIEQLYGGYFIDKKCIKNPDVVKHHKQFVDIWLSIFPSGKIEDYPIKRYIGFYKDRKNGYNTIGIPFLLHIDDIHVGYFNVYITNSRTNGYGYLYISTALFEKYRNKKIMSEHFDNIISMVSKTYGNHFYNRICIDTSNPFLLKVIANSKYKFREMSKRFFIYDILNDD